MGNANQSTNGGILPIIAERKSTVKQERANNDLPQNHPAFLNKEEQELSRRAFMKWMGAGAALMGLSLPACRRVEKYIVPYNEGPEWSVPGVETTYATCLNINGIVYPVLAACYEGRPVKLMPSLQYPEESGLTAQAQASILDLYDPNRSRHILFNGQRVAEDEFKGAFSSWARNLKDGESIGILLPPTDSPLMREMLEEIRRKTPHARLYTRSSLPRPGSAMQSGLKDGCGFRVRFARAKRILALDCDFLHENPYGCTKDFVKSRAPEGLNYKDDHKDRARLYAVESRLSLTGAHADHRLSLPPLRLRNFIIELYHALRKEGGNPNALTPHERHWLSVCVKDLASHPTESLVLLGDGHPEEAGLAPLVWAINEQLKAIGSTLLLQKEDAPLPHSGIKEFVTDLEQGKISIAFLLNAGNPVAESTLADRLKKALAQTESIHLGMYRDATANACRWHLPAAHALESWGIERDRRGRFCFRQPVILPLYGGISAEEVLSGLISTKGQLITADTAPNRLSPVYHRARKCFERAVNPEDKTATWNSALRLGYSDETAYDSLPAHEYAISPVQSDDLTIIPTLPPLGIEVQISPDYAVGDGEFIRNAWLRECPDPITGVSWAAGAQISPQTFRQLGGADNTPAYCTLSTPCGQMSVILCPIPGVAEHLIILPAGYGGVNILANNRIEGASRYALAPAQISLSPIPERTEAIQTPILTATPFNAAQNQPSKATPAPVKSAAPYQWKMAIDTDRCIGCNACLIACRAENNIPVLGKEQMARGRALDWIRIDRYFTANGGITALPVACQQCGQAPCESVCPVNATVHTAEGLNAMVYARCWGTRYCAANCPYKARRFNFFDYAKASEEHTRLQRNPNVTVRSRGVMEKCSYCVQMVERAKIRHKTELMKAHPGTPSTQLNLTEQALLLPDGAVQTACQMACPMDAITFGNAQDENALVTRAKSLPRHTTLLAHLNTQPATGYLTPVKNLNPEM